MIERDAHQGAIAVADGEALRAHAAALRPLARSLAPKLAPWKLDVALHLVHHGLNATAAVWPKRASVAEMSGLVEALLWKGLGSLR